MKKIFRAICMAFVVVLAGVVLTACKPGSVEKAQSKMEKAGYTVVAYEAAKDAEGFVGGFIATKVDVKDGSGTLTAVLFDSKENAEKFKEVAPFESVVLDGKWVYAGTENAIDAFLK